MMKRMRRIALWTSLASIGLFTVLSVAGACLGDKQAGIMFNSPPLVAFWFLLVILFVAGFFFHRNLIRSPALLATHLGALIVLAGAMYGSDTGHRLFGGGKVRSGYMRIYEGEAESHIRNQEGASLAALPFSLRLEDFWIEYYETDDRPWLLVMSVPTFDKDGLPGEPKTLPVEWELGRETTIPHTNVKLQVLDYLPSARPEYTEDLSGAKLLRAVPDPETGMPAIEFVMTHHGKQMRQWLLGLPDGTSAPQGRGLGLHLVKPRGAIKDYKSDLRIIVDGREVEAKVIEVNDALYYGGYHFYQTGYDDERGEYTVLSVESNSGLIAVFTGFALLVLGMFGQFWIRPVLAHLKARIADGS